MTERVQEYIIVVVFGPLAMFLGVALIVGAGMALSAWYERASRARGICPRCGGRDHE